MTWYRISFAGAGRVASALCRALSQAGHSIGLIVSESGTSGKSLAESCNASWSDELRYTDKSDLIIVAVPDHRLKEVLSGIKCPPGTLIAHTAGSSGLDIFPDNITNRSVFYPLQTFTSGREVDFRELPVLIQSSDAKSYSILAGIAESLGCKVYEVDAEQRRMIHLAAVFANNFSNFMLTSSKEIISETGFSFELMKPLIRETFSKALAMGPENSQTGPAVRNDINTIEKHMELLSFSTELKKLYIELTEAIIHHYKR
jgi:predicted short-subunit dehydrogenase-like oxidoreductase (DUF2520 family)